MNAAAELAADLRKALSQKPGGAIEGADIVQECGDMANYFSRRSSQFVVAPPQERKPVET